jgi:hypothetical protein
LTSNSLVVAACFRTQRGSSVRFKLRVELRTPVSPTNTVTTVRVVVQIAI